jgi:2'-5' RNA ligase
VFFALWPDAEVRAALESLARSCVAQTGGRAPEAANLHLTLAFIGEASTSGVATLREVGRSAAAAVPPFALILDRIGAFHKQEIAWVGSSGANESILALAHELATRVTSAGFELERRPFHPHVTLARRARTRVLDTMHSGALSTPIVWNVSLLTLAASTHAQGVLRYDAVDTWPLGGRPG